MTTDKNRIQAYIDDGLLERLKVYAASNRLSVSQAVERLLLESDSLLSQKSDSLSVLPSDDSDLESDSLRYTLEDAIEQIREWAMYNVYHPKRYDRMTYKEMAKKLRIYCYPLPTGVKAWTPEIVSRIIQNKGRL